MLRRMEGQIMKNRKRKGWFDEGWVVVAIFSSTSQASNYAKRWFL
jgi:hypothetical protein